MNLDIVQYREFFNVLRFMAEHPNTPKSVIVFPDENDGTNGRARFLRIKNLLENGLAEVHGDGFNCPQLLSLTEKGMKLYRLVC